MLETIISENRIFLDLHKAPKAVLLREVAVRLADAGQIAAADPIAAQLIRREEITTTGVKEGFAFPHAFTEEVPELILTIGLIPGGTDFESLDGRPVECLLMLLGPPSQNHLRVLARLSRIANEPGMLETVREIPTPRAMADLFLAADRRMAAAC